MTAKKLRNILILALGLIVVCIGCVMYFATSFLQSTQQATIQKQIDAELSSDDLNRLLLIESALNKNQPTVAKAAQIVSDSQQYQYQDQIIKDLDSYARQSGISINGYDFGQIIDPKAKKSRSAPQPRQQISGVKSIPVDISLDSPMPYRSFLQFLKLLEQNVSKMQVSGVNLAPDKEDVRLITNPSISLIIYVR